MFDVVSLKDALTCGRPLGLRMHGGSLYVVDSYLGLFKVSVETGNRSFSQEWCKELIRYNILCGYKCNVGSQ